MVMSCGIGRRRRLGEVALCAWVRLGSRRQRERRQAAIDMDNSLGHDLILLLFIVLLFVPLSSLKLILALWSMVVIVLKLLWFG